jgi:hypothetical protein
VTTCSRCEDSGWVCEDHPERPWDGPHACGCGGAGAPCPDCNASSDDPRPPAGFKPELDKKGLAALTGKGWDRRFEGPIPLPGGGNLVTLRDAADYITSLLEKETDLSEWQVAMEALLLVAERNGPEMLARIAVMKALNRHIER